MVVDVWSDVDAKKCSELAARLHNMVPEELGEVHQ